MPTRRGSRTTLELFGGRRPDGEFEAFSLYSMRQAIEEGFILDVLGGYLTYQTYWNLLKTVEDDPRFESGKAKRLLKRFVELSDHAIRQKVEVIVEHFHEHVQGQIAGKAKAMVVTRSRLHAVRTFVALRDHLAERQLPYRALVAFSGAVDDGGVQVTEAQLNGLPEKQTAATFNRPEFRFLVVAEKFQTGFDQPLPYAMYVDKRLASVHAVQTLSRLNRTHPEKAGTFVLDFANEPEAIEEAFQPYYESTRLSEGTDPNQLYDLEGELLELRVFTAADVDALAEVWFGASGEAAGQARLNAVLDPVVERYRELGDDEARQRFRKVLIDYVRLYGFLSQIIPFADSALEKLYVFARLLRRKLPVERESLPTEVLQAVDVESYRAIKQSEGRIDLRRGAGKLDPIVGPGMRGQGPDDLLEPLSRIIEELNRLFGRELSPAERVGIEEALKSLELDEALDASVRANTRENARYTFEQRFEETIRRFVDSNFQLYKRIVDDKAFGSALQSQLFDLYLRRHRAAQELIQQGESKTLEFKSTLRFDLELGRENPHAITHAVLKTVAAFLNTEGGDLLIGVQDDGTVVGIEPDGFESYDKLMLHLMQVVRNALGDRAGTCVDPKIQLVDGRPVCLVACSRSPEPVWLQWKGTEKHRDGDLFVRSGPGSVRLSPEDAEKYVVTRFGQAFVRYGGEVVLDEAAEALGEYDEAEFTRPEERG